jgi:hypothetical protein
MTHWLKEFHSECVPFLPSGRKPVPGCPLLFTDFFKRMLHVGIFREVRESLFISHQIRNLSFGTIFCPNIERLQMTLIPEKQMLPVIGVRSSLLSDSIPITDEKKLKIREFISWSVCFSVVVLLTGLMKLLRVAITMEVITSTLFYLSLAALLFFISRIIKLSKTSLPVKRGHLPELN